MSFSTLHAQTRELLDFTTMCERAYAIIKLEQCTADRKYQLFRQLRDFVQTTGEPYQRSSDRIDASPAAHQTELNQRQVERLFTGVRALGLRARVSNTLFGEGIRLVGDLVLLSKEKLRQIPSIGQYAVEEICTTLAEYRLFPGMILPDELVEQITAKSKKLSRPHETKAKCLPPDQPPFEAQLGKLNQFLGQEPRLNYYRFALHKAGIYTYGELVQRTEPQLKAIDGVGRKALRLILQLLELHGLSLGMQLSPEIVAQISDWRIGQQQAFIDQPIEKLVGVDEEHRLYLAAKYGVQTIGDYLIMISKRKYRTSEFDGSQAIRSLGFCAGDMPSGITISDKSTGK